MWFNVIKAIAARSLFAIHAFVAVWRVVDIRDGEPTFWYLACTLGLLLIEGIISICLRSGREMKWFCPSVFLYLCCIIPPTWMMELDLVHVRRQLAAASSTNVTLAHRRQKLSQIPGLEITIDLELPAEMWAKLLEQFLLVNLVLGRWLLPKGGLTRGQLSQLLLVYIGMAADIVELFEAFKEDVVNTNLELTCAVLALWSWSLMQFTLVLTATKARKPRLGVDNLTSKDYKTGNEGCCYPLKRFCAMDTWAIMTTIIFQDGPFLCLRLLLIFRYNIYRMSVLSFEERKIKKAKCSLQLSSEAEVGLTLPETNNEVYCSSECAPRKEHVVIVDNDKTAPPPSQWYQPTATKERLEKCENSQRKSRRKKQNKPVKKLLSCASPGGNAGGVFEEEEEDRDSVFVAYSQNKGAPWSDVSFTLSSSLRKSQRRPTLAAVCGTDSDDEQREKRVRNGDEEETKPLLTV